MGYLLKKDGSIVDESSGQKITNTDLIAKIQQTKKHLRIPPAYSNVVISKSPNAKVLACGDDSKHRRQCIYNSKFVEQQRDSRYEKIRRYDKVIQRLLRCVRNTLKQRDIAAAATKEYMICMLIHIMMLCNFRIGNEKYVKLYKSYGLSTLEWRHVKLDGNNVSFRFIGKKGVENTSVCNDKHVLAFVRQNKGNNNARVFNDITSKDVNKWISDFHPEAQLTSKDLRTWQANKLFTEFIGRGQSLKEALKNVATNLHHTPSVCKKNYIDPRLLLVQEVKSSVAKDKAKT